MLARTAGAALVEQRPLVELDVDGVDRLEHRPLAAKRADGHGVSRAEVGVREGGSAEEAHHGLVAFAPSMSEHGEDVRRRLDALVLDASSPVRVDDREHVREHGVAREGARHAGERLGEERRRAERDCVREDAAPGARGGCQTKGSREVARARRERNADPVGERLVQVVDQLDNLHGCSFLIPRRRRVRGRRRTRVEARSGAPLVLGGLVPK